MPTIILHRLSGLFLGLLVIGALLVGSSGAPADQRIAAVVNDEVVSALDLAERIRLVMVSSGIPDTPEARAQLSPQVLRGLVEETLQLQEAERLNITVTDEEVAGALANIAERNQMSQDQMRRFLADNDVVPETVEGQLRAQIAWVKLVNLVLRPRVTVTVDQLELAVEDARLNQGEEEYLLSEIVLPVDQPSQTDRVAQDATRLVQTLEEGASFPELARQVSASATAERGGDIGWVAGASIPPELLIQLERLQQGDISDPIVSPIGFHIFWLRDRRVGQPRVAPTQSAIEVDLAQILFPIEAEGDAAAIEALRQAAAALRARLGDCAAVGDVALELDAPASGRLGWIRIGDLPPEIGQTLITLEVGEISPPIRGPSGIHLLMVCERRGDPGVRSADEAAIAERLEQERLDRLARRYLRDLREQAFVETRI